MYNRYIPTETGYRRVEEPDGPSAPERQSPKSGGDAGPSGGALRNLLGGLTGGGGSGVKDALGGLLKGFHLEGLDTGDILLALIVLFLILEDGDNLDLVITLGLMILFSLGER